MISSCALKLSLQCKMPGWTTTSMICRLVLQVRVQHPFPSTSAHTLSGNARQRSFERRRPLGPYHMTPEIPIPAREERRRPVLPRRERSHRQRQRHVPASPLYDRYGERHTPMSSGFEEDYFWPPPAPDAPSSPTTTTFSQSSSTSSSVAHWVPRLFEQARSTTPFVTTGPV